MFLFLYNKNIIPRQDRHKNYSHSMYIEIQELLHLVITWHILLNI